MARLTVCVLALLVAGGFTDPVKKVQQKPADHTCLEHQHKLLPLFYHVNQPNDFDEWKEIIHTWNIQTNAQLYSNETAVHITCDMLKHNWTLPKGVPFSVLDHTHNYQAVVFFNLLYSAKTFDTFYKTAVFLRWHLNEELFTYILSVAIYHRHDTQDIVVPPLYNVLPSYFFNSEIIHTAHRITSHGHRWIEHYPSTYIWDDNVVIRLNETTWPYINHNMPLAYFTHDPALNSLYYTSHLTYPFWLGQQTCPLIKDKRGEWFWFMHKQLLARYYMERLSNGLGEIEELDWDVVDEGYSSGLSYWNGIPFPTRPDHFHLHSPWIVEKLEEIEVYENRIRDAIDKGFIITETGEHVDIRKPEAIDILGRLIEANADSPNPRYYKDFISIWKKVLGNSMVKEPVEYHKNVFPYVLPSVLEHYQTALRDPAFYMIFKRVLGLFDLWLEQLPHYTHEELTVPSVHIEKVDVDKLVTYFEYSYVNITNELYWNDFESEHEFDKKSVLVQRPQLNHKVFTVRVHVNSEAAKHVTVRFFLAPKYDSIGREIPLHVNYHNFFLLDIFDYKLTEGENVITRVSTENMFTSVDLYEGDELYEKVESALHGNGQYLIDATRKPDEMPRRLLLPKGRVGGMPFVLMVHISEYHAPNVLYGTGFDPVTSLGLGTGARHLTSDPLRFPVDRPLHQWQVEDLKNIMFQDVVIHHKHTPEVFVDHVQ